VRPREWGAREPSIGPPRTWSQPSSESSVPESGRLARRFCARASCRAWRWCLAHKKTPPPRTLQ
jgi:hypothetical protein